MRLSKNFTLNEFTKSQTATRKNIGNIPREEHINAAIQLFENVLQPVRDNFGITIITSGYRSKELNKAIGGSSKSQHCIGEAVDFEIPMVSNLEIACWIRDHLEFDQLILEGHDPKIADSGWIHVSYSRNNNRNQVLTADFSTGKAVYREGL